MCWQHKDVCLEICLRSFGPVERSREVEALELKRVRQLSERLLITRLAAAYHTQAPVRMCVLQLLPGMEQPISPLFRMNSAQEQQSTLGRGGSTNRQSGKIDPIRNDSYCRLESQCTDLRIFDLACGMNQVSPLEHPALHRPE